MLLLPAHGRLLPAVLSGHFLVFLGKPPNGVYALCHILHPLSFIIHHKVSGSNILKTVTILPRIIKFYSDILSSLLYSRTGYASFAASDCLQNTFKFCTNVIVITGIL